MEEMNPQEKKLSERLQLVELKLQASEAQVIRQLKEVEVLFNLVKNLEKSLSIADAQIKERDALIAVLMGKI